MSNEIFNQQRIKETLRVEPGTSRFWSEISLIRSTTYKPQLAWLEAVKVFDYVLNEGTCLDLEKVKAFFLIAKEAHRISTLSGHVEHLTKYKRTKSALIDNLAEDEVETYQKVTKFLEDELIDGKLRFL